MNTLPEIANRKSPIVNISKPRKVCVPLAAGLAWGPEPGIVYQEKMDGRFSIQTVIGRGGEATIAGELVRGGKFWAFDCLEYCGADLRHRPYAERLKYLEDVFAFFIVPNHFHLLPSTPDPSPLLPAVLARGGEGIVRKRLDAPWGTVMLACKRLETFYCVVTGFRGGSQSVELSRITEPDFSQIANRQSAIVNATPCGAVALRGGKCDRVRVGSIVKIEGMGITSAGQIREPRPCQDTPTSWFVRY